MSFKNIPPNDRLVYTTAERGLTKIKVKEVFIKNVGNGDYRIVFKDSNSRYYLADSYVIGYRTARTHLRNWKSFALNRTLRFSDWRTWELVGWNDVTNS